MEKNLLESKGLNQKEIFNERQEIGRLSEITGETFLKITESTSLNSIKAKNEAALNKRFKERAPSSPFYEGKSSRLRYLKRLDRIFTGVDGYAEAKIKTLSARVDSARGSFEEITKAYHLHRKGYDILAIGKAVETKYGITDIDILAKKNNKLYWFEIKDVRSKMSLSKGNKLRIDKMTDSLENGAIGLNDGKLIKPDRVVFVNRGEIGNNLIKYGENNSIHIKQKMGDSAIQKYAENLANS